MITISEDLLEQVERGNVLLFIADRILTDSEGQAEVDQIAAELAARCRIDNLNRYSLPEAAQAYEDDTGRHALVQYLRDRIETLDQNPLPAHRLIARLTDCKVLATTCLDQRLERAFEEVGRPLNVIVDKLDLAFEDERKTRLYKLCGSLEQVESLVLTEDDHEGFFDDQTSISVVLQGYLARKTILFLGYDLAAPHFKRLYRKVTAPLDDYARRSYAFGDAPDPRVARWCKRHNIEVVSTPVTPFLEALTEQLTGRARPTLAIVQPRKEEQPAASLPRLPYKLLDHYETKDTAIFFGRGQETRQLTATIHAHRLVLLYGASGVGKTSLIQAGTVPQLEQADPPYETITVRALEDPEIGIRRAVRRRLPEAHLPEDGSLLDTLDAAAQALNRTLVIVLDQFEEFFIRFNSRLRASFIAELGRVLDARDLPVKVVFSLREDWLASMSEIEDRIPDVYRTKMRLLPLSREQASQAIRAPVEQLGMSYDPALVDQLLDDLAGEELHQVRDSNSSLIMPPQMQLVCDALYNRTLGLGRNTIVMADYQAIGRTEGVLGRYVESALDEHPAVDREVAKGVLIALVTSKATKASYDLNSVISSIGAEQAVVERAISRLIGQRLVRWVDEYGAFELTHEILAATIAGWINEEDRQLKQTRELLLRELADWQRDPALFLSQSKFQHINGFRDTLPLSDEEITFLFRAAIAYGEEVPYWLERVREQGSPVRVLLDMLNSEVTQARLTAARYLGRFQQEGVAMALAHTSFEDPDPAVRDIAAVSLGQMGDSAGINLLLETAKADDHLKRNRSICALALVLDVSPTLLGDLNVPFWRKPYYELGKIRFWRNWPRIRKFTMAGAVGGALGFGLGLSPPIVWHSLVLYPDVVTSIMDMFFIVPVFAFVGLLAGAGMAMGASVGESLLSERVWLGRIVGGTILGGLAFTVVLSPLSIVDGKGALSVTLTILGSGLFGITTGLGLTVALAISLRRAFVMLGATAGAALGIVIFGILGYVPFQVIPAPTVPTPLLLASGGFVGLILAISIVWAEAKWPVEVLERQGDYFLLNPKGLSGNTEL